jgi:hypothetical protein
LVLILKLVDKLYWFFMFTLSNDFSIINKILIYKKELNAIKKNCKINNSNFEKKSLIKMDNFFVKLTFIKRDRENI